VLPSLIISERLVILASCVSRTKGKEDCASCVPPRSLDGSGSGVRLVLMACATWTAAAAAADGWRVVYLGPNLPAEEIAAVANQLQARAVALSVVYPPDDAKLPQELRDLRKHLADDVPLIVGGRVAGSYQKVLDEIQSLRIADLEGLRPYLESLRSQPAPA